MIKLGGFIITFHRPGILMDTLDQVFNQTFPPEFIWVIDNSKDDQTLSALIKRDDNRIKYHYMGYNAGPAGAAKKGLELCSAEDLAWIYWGHDNDPPKHLDTFEKLLAIKDDNPFCGILGAVGHFFDYERGSIKRIQSRLLERKISLEVECLSVGMSMLVHRDVIKVGVFPDPDLFLGFEELDFCLKAKRRGFDILVNCELFLRLRKMQNEVAIERSDYKKKDKLVLEYYFLRNLLYISDSLTLNAMKKQLIWKWIGKSVYGFRYGLKYGVENFRYIFLAFLHYHKGIKGKTLSLV
ncbi:glycosyltransferase [Algoriphagus antarcticus]|uniref:GT2 family glycosyltransferase n=1 Tax=Algoriphagus antarcticus TaxID=238540 RepID=A0A3E0DZX6_9BACT|nr:glycosyltransferase [Algoriphagus antarcticus]REG91521.1 GT2 family glycosyltransferase [Algoriphagus antarcticus]